MANDNPSDTVLDEAPARALKFLGAAGHNASIYSMLVKRGYGKEAHDAGWQLLLEASGYRRPPPPAVTETPSAQAALAEIDAWDEPNFQVAHATLDGEYPAQSDFLFADLHAQTGAGAIVSVTTFLDRLDILEAGKGRKATHKQDLAAVKKLAARGITAVERKSLRKLLAEAAVVPSMPKPAPTAKTDANADPAAARKAKVALYRWYAEWSGVARADVKRRDYLLQLGLAKRKVKKKAAAAASDPTPTDALGGK